MALAILIGAGVLLVMGLIAILSGKPAPPVVVTHPIDRGEPAPEAPHIEGHGDFDQPVVGEAHYQAALDAICGGKCEEGHELEVVAELVPEPSNPHDANAVAVFIGGRKVGYLPRDIAYAWSEGLRNRGSAGRRYSCDAMIVGGWRRTKRSGQLDEGSYGVRLDLPL
ncbi:HIRAN domain-containing protein [Phenylobacterium sp.]|uniref:HIRAN domain-containing protein n=1 Tax=Phenylobacterium sp. TaxID=1871053 RepID=UPI003941B47A